MLYTMNCPNCGAEQKGLDLEETEGSFVCSCCGEQVQIDLEKTKNEKIHTAE